MRPSPVVAPLSQLVLKPNNVSALVQLRTQTFPRALLFWLRLAFDAAGCTDRRRDHERPAKKDDWLRISHSNSKLIFWHSPLPPHSTRQIVRISRLACDKRRLPIVSQRRQQSPCRVSTWLRSHDLGLLANILLTA